MVGAGAKMGGCEDIVVKKYGGEVGRGSGRI